MKDGLPLILNRLEISLDEIINSKLLSLQLIKSIKKNQILYHYTNLEGLQNIVNNKCLFFSNSAFLNDKQEFLKGSESFKNILENKIGEQNDEITNSIFKNILSKIVDTKNSERYVACFSLKGDLLSQWRAYSNDGKGVCIGFEYTKLKNTFYGIESFPIIYDEDSQKKIAELVLNESKEFYLTNKNTLCDEFLLSDEEFSNLISTEIFNQTSKYIGQFKHNAFDEEIEFRFEIRIDNDFNNNREVSYRCGRNNLFVPYIEEKINESFDDLFPIKEIIIGPSLNSELNKLSISSFLAKKGYGANQIDIRESNVPYRI